MDYSSSDFGLGRRGWRVRVDLDRTRSKWGEPVCLGQGPRAPDNGASLRQLDYDVRYGSPSPSLEQALDDGLYIELD